MRGQLPFCLFPSLEMSPSRDLQTSADRQDVSTVYIKPFPLPKTPDGIMPGQGLHASSAYRFLTWGGWEADPSPPGTVLP